MLHPMAVADRLVLSVAALVIALPLASRAASAQTFVEGDLAKLTARVTKTKPVDGKRKGDSLGTLLTIEVGNRGAHHAEPVSIALTAKRTLRDKNPIDVVLHRFDGGSYGRAGRAVAPNRKATYRFVLPHPVTTRCGLEVRVVSASFFDGEPVDTMTIRAKRTGSGTYPLGTMTCASTKVRLRNPLDAPVDVAFLATLGRPYDGVGIVRRRLEPNEVCEWEIYELPSNVRNYGLYNGVDVERLSLIDWSVIRSDGAGVAATVFRDAYERWMRWPDGTAIAGRFAFTERFRPSMQVAGLDAYDVSASGRFTIDADGKITVDGDGELDPRARKGVQSGLRDATAGLRRPPVEKVLGKIELSLVERGPRTLVRFKGGSWTDLEHGIQGVGVVDGRIVGTLHGERIYDHYRMVPYGDRFLLVGRRLEPNPGQASQRWSRIEHGEVDGLVVPVGFTMMWDLGGPKHSRLRLSGIRRIDADDAAAAGAPTGDGVDALRAAWDATDRLPPEPLRVRGRFTAIDDGRTEDLWQGVKKVTGTVDIRGYRGTRYAGATTTVADDVPEERRRHLGEVVMDRFRIWFHRDFNARPAFDDAFRGATIRTIDGEPGVFAITGADYVRIETSGGRIVAFVTAVGLRRTLRYSAVGKRTLCTEMRTGDERVRATYRDAGAFPFPTKLVFERVFGPDWGPETIRVSGVQVERDG